METKEIVKSEVQDYAKFNIIRYAQVWEDAEILLDALEINNNDNVLSIASAGENALSLLIHNPEHVYAIDLNDEQIFCCELKIAAIKNFEYDEAMELIGIKESSRRKELYERIKEDLSENAREYFASNMSCILSGIINNGKFEKYLTAFGKRILPLIHSKKTRLKLLEPKSREERIKFYDEIWDNRRWRLLFKIFFSRKVMGKMGRDKAFFRYVETDVASNILKRTKYAITELDTSQNSYLHYIIKGKYENVLPLCYRKDNFEIIKKNIDKISLHSETVENFIQDNDVKITKYNLSDIFEYMSEEQMTKIVEKIIENSPKGSILAYWNMLSPKRASEFLENKLLYKEEKSKELLGKDKAFFYSAFIVEEIK